MRLRYTPEAARDLDAVLTNIAERSARGARRVQARIQQAIDFLLDHRRAGQVTSRPGLRRIAATPFPTSSSTKQGVSEIVVISVRHAARDAIPRPRRR